MTIYNPNCTCKYSGCALVICCLPLICQPHFFSCRFKGTSEGTRFLWESCPRCWLETQNWTDFRKSNSIFMSNQVLAYESFPPPQVSIYPMVLHGTAMHVGQDAYSTLPMSRFLLSRDQKLLWSRHLGLWATGNWSMVILDHLMYIPISQTNYALPTLDVWRSKHQFWWFKV